MRPIAGEREEIHQHSGWWLPLGFGVVILVLCALVLGWYLRPLPQAAAPTGESRIVHLAIHGVHLDVPANYIATQRARSGGVQDSVALAALFPSFRGFSREDAALFSGNAPDSPVIRLTLRGDTARLDARGRLERIYRPYLSDPAGSDGPFGLTQYAFRSGSGYEASELFAGSDAQGLELFLCEKPSPANSSPNCLALDRPLSPGGQASLSWRFKRAYLSRWREVTTGVHALMARFAQKKPES
jgi:hypothetical protein